MEDGSLTQTGQTNVMSAQPQTTPSKASVLPTTESGSGSATATPNKRKRKHPQKVCASGF